MCGTQASPLRMMRSPIRFTNRAAQRVLDRVDVSEVTWEQAEREAWMWMRRHGFRDAQLTTRGADGGVDIRARKAVAQVKATAKPVGRPAVQNIYGIADREKKKRALVFSLNGYTDPAIDWADDAGVALFSVHPVEPINRHARKIR